MATIAGHDCPEEGTTYVVIVHFPGPSGMLLQSSLSRTELTPLNDNVGENQLFSANIT